MQSNISRKRGVPTEWLKGQDDPEALEEHLRNLVNSRFSKRLREVLEARLDQLINTGSDFNNPNWSHVEAHRQGRVKELVDILTLISFNEERT